MFVGIVILKYSLSIIRQYNLIIFKCILLLFILQVQDFLFFIGNFIIFYLYYNYYYYLNCYQSQYKQVFIIINYYQIYLGLISFFNRNVNFIIRINFQININYLQENLSFFKSYLIFLYFKIFIYYYFFSFIILLLHLMMSQQL